MLCSAKLPPGAWQPGKIHTGSGFPFPVFPRHGKLFSEYKKMGYPPVSHSASYRLAYNPSYRVVMQSHADFLRLIRTLDSFLQKNIPFILAIDGNCASGKTTLSRLLAMYFDCNIIPMDDFFLPPGLRTDERLALTGKCSL